MKKKPSVKNYMTASVLTLKADMSIYKAIDFLLKHKISGAPVVDNNNKLIGIISEKDCFQLVTKGADHNPPDKIKVSDFMTKKVKTISPKKDIYAVADMFFNETIRRLPVVSVYGTLVGQISRRDVLQAIRENLYSKKIMGDLAAKATLVEKEKVNRLKFPSSEVLTSKSAIKARRTKLEKATLLGNIEHNKVKIIFESKEGLMKVNATIWATTEKNISLKSGILIPINRIREIRML